MISPFPTQAQAPVVKTPGVVGQQGLNIKGAVPVPAAPVLPRASQMPIRPVPKSGAGGPTGGGFGADHPKPSKAGGASDLGAELAKAQQAANKATQGDLDSAIGALNSAEAAIGREANALRSALYADAKASVEIARRTAVEGAAQMGIALNPFLMEGVMQRADTVAMSQYRRGAAEIRQQVAQERMVLAQSKASLFGSITRQGIDPALAARIAEATGAGRAARDAMGRLTKQSDEANRLYIEALKQLQAEMGIIGGGAQVAKKPAIPGAPTTVNGRELLAMPQQVVPGAVALPSINVPVPGPIEVTPPPADTQGAPIEPSVVAAPDAEPDTAALFPTGSPGDKPFRLAPGTFTGQYQTEAVNMFRDVQRRVKEADRGTPLGAKYMEMVSLLQQTPIGSAANLSLIPKMRKLKEEFDALYRQQWGGR